MRAERILLGALLLVALPARAGSPRLEIEAAEECEGHVPELRARLERALAEAGAESFSASVSIAPSNGGYRVVLRTPAATALSEKVIAAPSCDEAAGVAVVVLSLAARAEARPEPLAPAPVAAPRAASSPIALSSLPAAAPPSAPRTRARAAERSLPSDAFADERAEAALAAPAGADATRLSLATGADAGTLPRPTLYVAAGAGRSFSALEVRGLLRYGLPTIEEDEDGGSSESHRSDFAALELRACYGTATKLRVQACSGAELGAVRSRHRVEQAGALDVDEDTLNPRLSGVLAAVVAHRGGMIQPELEVSGSAVAAGREPGDSWLVLRVAAGAAVAF
jgi:hypothetical protein